MKEPKIKNSFPEWISVNDRLPEPGLSVLVFENPFIAEASIVGFSKYYYEQNPSPIWASIGEAANDPTHWMPLPEQPTQ